MARTIRVWWPKQTTGWVNFNWGGVIDGQSVVHVSACEATDVPGQTFGFPQEIAGNTRMRGAAVIGVRNVRPHHDNGGGGGVEFYLEINWDSPLNVVTDITVMDPPEAGAIV